MDNNDAKFGADSELRDASEEENMITPNKKYMDALRIIETVEEDHSFRLDIEALERILLVPEITDKKVNFFISVF